MKTLIMILISFFAVTSFAAGIAESGKKKSAMCAACHGEGGKSVNPLWPSLAGQQSQYLLKQLQDFKAGRRQDPLMGSIIQTLSEQDMEDLAAYYSSLK